MLLLIVGHGPVRSQLADKSSCSKYGRLNMLSGNFPCKPVQLSSSDFREEEIKTNLYQHEPWQPLSNELNFVADYLKHTDAFAIHYLKRDQEKLI